jgi:hypothetical protein
MQPVQADDNGQVRLDGGRRNVKARVIGDFAPDDAAGIAGDYPATPHNVSERSAFKLGDWTFGQDSGQNGTKDFFIMDANGVIVSSWTAGAPSSSGLGETQYNAINTGTPATPTGVQFAGAADVTINMTAVLGGAGTLNTPTAAQIIAAIPRGQVGQTYRLRIINSSGGAFAWTVTAGANVTLNGTMTIAQNTWRDFYVTITGANAVSVQSIGTGTFS